MREESVASLLSPLPDVPGGGWSSESSLGCPWLAGATVSNNAEASIRAKRTVPHRRNSCTIVSLRLYGTGFCVPDPSWYEHFVGMTPLASSRSSPVAPFARVLACPERRRR